MNSRLILLQILAELKHIQQDPDISAQLDKFYSLNDAAQKKVEDAQQLIAQADMIKAKLDTLEDELNRYEAEIKLGHNNLDKAIETYNQKVIKLEEDKAGFFIIQKAHNNDVLSYQQKHDALESRAKELDLLKDLLDSRSVALDAREAESDTENNRLKELEATLKAKAAKLKKQAEDF